MNCTFTNQSSSSSRTSRRAAASSSGWAQVSKYIASPARIASRVLAWPSTSRPPRQMPSTVCSLPVASSITSSGGKSSLADRLERLVDRERQRAGPRLEQRLAPIDVRREHAEAARALGCAAASCRRRAPDSRARPRRRGTPPGVRARCARGDLTPARSASAIVCALSSQAAIASGDATISGIANSSRLRRELHDLAARLREDDVDALARGDLGDGRRELVARPGRHDVEAVAQEAPAAALAHVRADDRQLALAVLLQRPDQPRGPGRARGGEQHAQRPQRHTTHRTTSKHSANGRPISMPCVRARLRMYSSFA